MTPALQKKKTRADLTAMNARPRITTAAVVVTRLVRSHFFSFRSFFAVRPGAPCAVLPRLEERRRGCRDHFGSSLSDICNGLCPRCRYSGCDRAPQKAENSRMTMRTKNPCFAMIFHIFSSQSKNDVPAFCFFCFLKCPRNSRIVFSACLRRLSFEPGWINY